MRIKSAPGVGETLYEHRATPRSRLSLLDLSGSEA